MDTFKLLIDLGMLELVNGDKTFTREQALAMPANFEAEGQLYLAYCPICKRENWLPALASGMCAICGATEEPISEADHDPD
jgi:hypothetical protein